jgi:hypothetical protein
VLRSIVAPALGVSVTACLAAVAAASMITACNKEPDSAGGGVTAVGMVPANTGDAAMMPPPGIMPNPEPQPTTPPPGIVPQQPASTPQPTIPPPGLVAPLPRPPGMMPVPRQPVPGLAPPPAPSAKPDLAPGAAPGVAALAMLGARAPARPVRTQRRATDDGAGLRFCALGGRWSRA